ncbi:protein-methionine-sulfoxide reductase catalytic subunit MsrP [Campylobacter pinnipediorum]|uniref:protein-methionine-sulfoxide reductase catalytic subunit MsrP n=1 Tax=Campylobacter pinnipediorum TaxID=1965231 RepID=UPI00084DB858|nr:protein-methionine-sulfoxide reductase catalytic subunit MsrP [Campylobacter pinnipediorum]
MQITDERFFNKRREFLKLGAMASLAAINAKANELGLIQDEKEIFQNILNLEANNETGRKLTSYENASSYVNFYEFSTNKTAAAKQAKDLNTDGWMVSVGGECERPMNLSINDMLKFKLQKRVYRFRCVEAWGMVVPWVGFELRELIKLAKPTNEAKFIKFTTLLDPNKFPDQKSTFPNIPYPYVEGLRMDEAMHPLTIIALGMYDKPLGGANGAPLRLVVPWKYGFKSIKSIAKIEFVKEQPKTTWEQLAPNEYGFYANVNPNVDHPRWSQANERVLGSFKREKTLMFNGYDEVASLYNGMDLEKFF